MELHTTLYTTFENFEKALDSVRQGSLWKTTESYGIPHKKIRFIQIIREDSEYEVIDD